MKEFTIEEKAQRYDKAINRMKRYVIDEYGCTRIRVTDVFPELKENESDDEKIRKAIVWGMTALKEQGKETFATININDCIAWLEKQGNLVKYYEDKLDRCACDNFNKGYKKALEKQGEQKLIEYPLCRTVKDKIDYYIVNHFTTDTVVKTDINSIVKAMEEGVMIGMSEQKPVWTKWDEERYLSCLKKLSTGNIEQPETVNTVWFKSLKDRVFPQLQQKWSKKDENIIEWLIGYLEYQIINATITEEKNNCLDAISMLKSLKDRVQTKQEWSEVDAMQLDAAIHIVANSGHTCTSDWLKALKERYAWKPSDEQIACLQDAVTRYVREGFIAATLTSLLEQLKKLREE